jgi:hypothetical protein
MVFKPGQFIIDSIMALISFEGEYDVSSQASVQDDA